MSNVSIGVMHYKPPWTARTRMLTVKDVAKRLNVSARLVYALAGKKFPCYRFESALRFKEEEIEAYIESCKGNPALPSQERPTTLRHLRI